MRSLLLLSGTATDETFHTDLEQANWKVFLARDRIEARTVLLRERLRVGLVRLAPHDQPESLHWIQDILTDSPALSWVALVSPQALKASAVQNLIRDYCHDYHTEPLATERLLVTLGHARGMSLLHARAARRTERAGGRFHMIGASPAMVHSTQYRPASRRTVSKLTQDSTSGRLKNVLPVPISL